MSAMGPVYLAREHATGGDVVVKQIHDVGAYNPMFSARYPAQAEALKRMRHPRVIAVYDLEASGRDLFVITEYVQDLTLRLLMDRFPMTWSATLRVLSDVATALDYAGAQAVVHGDLKPGNVFVDASWRARVGDFGLISLLSGVPASSGVPGPILGTPAYMSPEHAAGGLDSGPASDIYSLAVMAYELLVGRLPFPSIPGDAHATLDAHISAPVPLPSSSAPGFPAPVEVALLHGLAKHPHQRPATARMFMEELATAAATAWTGWGAAPYVIAVDREPAQAPPAPKPIQEEPGLQEAVEAAPALPVEAPEAPPEPPALRPLIAADLPAPPAPEEATRRRRLPSRRVALLLLVALLGLAVVLGPNLPAFLRGPLKISSVSVTVSPTTGHCPSAVYLFTGTVVSNGQGGPVAYRWSKPYGRDTGTTTRSIPSGQTESTATLEFKFQGQGSTEGDAVLHIQGPTKISSAPAHIVYRCP
jgi:serine/threonine-protein kinase